MAGGPDLKSVTDAGAPEPALSLSKGLAFETWVFAEEPVLAQRHMSYDDRMAKGLVRFQQSGQFHFVTFSCYARQPNLGSPAARETFERSLEAMRTRYQFVVAGYVVMPEHVHFLVSEPKKVLLSRAIQALKLSVAVQRRERPFWQPRYYDFNVWSEHKRKEKLRYMHRNPVSRGLAAEPSEWAWPSFNHWATGEIGTVEIESQWTATRREGGTMGTHISKSRCGAPAFVAD
jgi:putative transposase